MKKIQYSIFVTVFLLAMLLCGCSGEPGQPSAGKTYISGAFVYDYAYNDLGMVYDNNQAKTTGSSFLDPESGKSAPLCTKVNCSHETLDCDAHLGLVTCDTIIGDRLYYVDSPPQYGEKDFYVADVNGTNRRRLHHVENAQDFLWGSYEEGYLIYAYRNSYQENGEYLEPEEAGIYLLNLETEELDHVSVAPAYSIEFMSMTIAQGKLYYICLYSLASFSDFSPEDFQTGVYLRQLKTELWSYDLSSRESTCIWSRGRQSGHITARMSSGHLFEEDPDNRSAATLQDLATGETISMDLGEMGDSDVQRFICEDGVLFFGNGLVGLWRFDNGTLEKTGSYSYDENDICMLEAVTEHWVYAKRFQNSHYMGIFYTPRDPFMKGEPEWKEVPGTS